MNYMGLCICVLLCFIMCLSVSDCTNHHGAKVSVQPTSYKPCYIRLDEEQFERLLEVMKSK